ncbi:hypothetical protein H6P81_020867 [Aristolochia fimbriata]|uniref:Uncharacterized protein n=1 Tax=Aristolochia fimbriata TaxID=158543 RepID=A0AAV7DYQ5_ARIFI|nr:hypothetical protein H6P81_020867 [Aristolochia fimbriata]
MDAMCKELDESRAALERLKEDYKVKAELSECLMKAQNEQLDKFQEAKLEIQKQALELNKKNEELSLATQANDNLKQRLHEKESVLKHLSSTQEQLRTSFSEKIHNLERENKELLSALDEANAKGDDQERMIGAFKVETECLKGLVSTLEKKCLDAEQRSKVPEELRRRDSLLQEFEEENSKVQDKLKWRNEQFQHLEEAYEKLQQQFEACRTDWESEKALLLEEISSLQQKSESLSRVLEAVQTQLGLCNQALAHEQSQKKLLEIQLFELKRHCDTAAEEYEETKSALENLTQKRDEDVASLRNTLSGKETLLKEMRYSQLHLEQENQDLKESLKELQEAGINRAGSTASISKLRQKLRGLEQVHKNCSVVLEAKETEFNARIETIENELHASQFQLGARERQINELCIELEDCYSSLEQLKIQNEEISMTLLVLKSELSMSPLKSDCDLMDREQSLGNAKEQIIILTEQLRQKVNNLVKAESEVEKGQQLVALLAEKHESAEQLNLLMQKELQSCKEMLEESYKYQNKLKENAAKKERDLTDELAKASDALDKANFDLAETEVKERELKSETLQWKTVAGRLEVSKKNVESDLKDCWEKNKAILKEIEAANLSKIKNEKALVELKNHFSKMVGVKDRQLDNLRQEIESLEQESMRRETEAAIFSAGKMSQAFSQEKEQLMQMGEEKDEKINDLQVKLELLQQELTNSVNAAVNSLAEKQYEIDALHNAGEKLIVANISSEFQVQYLELLILELGEEISGWKQKLKLIEIWNAELKVELLTKDRAKEQLIDKIRKLECLIEELNFENKGLLEMNRKLSTEKDELLSETKSFSDKLEEVLGKDAELIGSLKMLAFSAGIEDEFEEYMKEGGMFRENNNALKILPSSRLKEERIVFTRSPLKDLNS